MIQKWAIYSPHPNTERGGSGMGCSSSKDAKRNNASRKNKADGIMSHMVRYAILFVVYFLHTG